MILKSLDSVAEFKDGIKNKHDFAPKLIYKEYNEGEILFQSEESPTFFYLLLDGQVQQTCRISH
jgi:hypothetical protein